MAFVEIDRINCIDDHGNEYTVIVSENILTYNGMDSSSKAKGRKAIILSDGRKIKMIGNDFKVFETLDDNEIRIKAIE